MSRKKPGSQAQNLEDLVLKDDSNDEDYDDAEQRRPNPPRRSSGKSTKKAKGKSKQASAKRKQSQRYSSEEDEEISEVEDDLSISERSSRHSTEESQDKTALGRPLRRAVKKAVPNYVEKSEDDDDIEDDSDDPPSKKSKAGARTGSKKPKNSLVIKLRVPQGGAKATETRQTRRSTRSASAQPRPPLVGGKGYKFPTPGPSSTSTRQTRGARPPSVDPPSGWPGTRRSSRNNRDSAEPLMALDPAGHVQIFPHQVSDIKEESHEDTSRSESAIHDEEELPDAQAPPADVMPNVDDDFEVDISAPWKDDGKDDEEEPEAVAPEEPPEVPAPAEADAEAEADDEDDDDIPVSRGRRQKNVIEDPSSPQEGQTERATRSRNTREISRKTNESDEDEYQDDGGEDSADEVSSAVSSGKRRRGSADEGPSQRKKLRRSQSQHSDEEEDEEDPDELQQELSDLQQPRTRRARQKARQQVQATDQERIKPIRRAAAQGVNYKLWNEQIAQQVQAEEEAGRAGSSTPNGRRNGKTETQQLFDTRGPFGGARARRTAEEAENDDDPWIRRPKADAANSAMALAIIKSADGARRSHSIAQPLNLDPLQAGTGALGKVKTGKRGLGDIDPLGVPEDVNLDAVGGMKDKIQELKEMVMLPMLYPELFIAKKVQPPRGVLFHGPPGTGKTLMARALAHSVGKAQGGKVTFYMRKGADVLSKWVGEAERQLRMLFEEAKKNQPSIIFFDEIDGLAPVRSSKQDQIHASMVATLLALMDGMDGRGQVIVIGATNRPDTLDPALRRPGRFDREFYFPLPDQAARREIIDIHTSGWMPPLDDRFKDRIAKETKGYGGADLRGLCTEAGLIAIQRTYPQIYGSDRKLLIDHHKVKVTARDFVLARKKIVPSSERSGVSIAAPLPDDIVHLLGHQLEKLVELIKQTFPVEQEMSTLEEANYIEDHDYDHAYEHEEQMQALKKARTFRPRLLICGLRGLGQGYLGPALLQHLEKVFVQSFDLASLSRDPSMSEKAAVVQLFTEVKRHTPSVIYIANVHLWYQRIGEDALATFKEMLNALPGNDRVMVIGTAEETLESLKENDSHKHMLRDLFGFNRKSRFELSRPEAGHRRKFFEKVIGEIKKTPDDYPPDPSTRQRRELEPLPEAPPAPPPVVTDEELQVQGQDFNVWRHVVKSKMMPQFELLRHQRYRKFKASRYDDAYVAALIHGPSPDAPITSDLQQKKDKITAFIAEDGNPRVVDTETGRAYYNMNLDVIEERFTNGQYAYPHQMIEDLRRINDDLNTARDKEGMRKFGDLLTQIEVQLHDVLNDTEFLKKCEEMEEREKKRLLEVSKRKKKAAEEAERARVLAIEDAPVEGGPVEGAQAERAPSEGAPAEDAPAEGATADGAPAEGSHQSQQSNGVHPDGDRQTSPHHTDDNRPASPQPSLAGASNAATAGSAFDPMSIQNLTQHDDARSDVTVTPAKAGASSTSLGIHSRVNSQATLDISVDASPTTDGSKDSSKRNSNISAVNNSQSQSSHNSNSQPHTNSQPNSQEHPARASQQNSQEHPARPSQPNSQEHPARASGSDSNPRQSGSSGRPSNSTDGGGHPWRETEYTEGDSQLPDTQSVHNEHSQHSQPPASQASPPPSGQQHLLPQTSPDLPPQQSSQLPASQPSQIPSSQLQFGSQDMVPYGAAGPSRSQARYQHSMGPPPKPAPDCQDLELERLHTVLCDETSGFSVEQLQQVNAELMSVCWRHRGTWARKDVKEELEKVFKEVREDVKEMQETEEASSSFS